MRTMLSALVLLAAVPLTHAADCLRYEPEQVSLHGELVRKTFPGRPNFESIAGGDEAETGFYLLLTEPVCMLEGRDGTNDTARADVRLVQLVLDQAGYDRLRPELGKTITVKGTLFAPFTGHHHGDMVMNLAPTR